MYSSFEQHHKMPLQRVLPEISEAGRDLLEKMILFNPKQRITALNALQHYFFVQSVNDAVNVSK